VLRAQKNGYHLNKSRTGLNPILRRVASRALGGLVLVGLTHGYMHTSIRITSVPSLSEAAMRRRDTAWSPCMYCTSPSPLTRLMSHQRPATQPEMKGSVSQPLVNLFTLSLLSVSQTCIEGMYVCTYVHLYEHKALLSSISSKLCLFTLVQPTRL
jgi:hypothetical protein